MSHDPAEIAATCWLWHAPCGGDRVDPADIAGVGISNQRETTVAWSRTTGEPLCDAWCGSAPAPASCATSWLRAKAWPSWCVTRRVWCSRPTIRRARWPGSSRTFPRLPSAAAGELCLGTIDAWVVWTLTGGAEFRCDWSNASRTQLFDLRRGCWSEPVCEAFGVNPACLPQVTDSDGLFGTTDLGGFLPAPVPIHGVLGDSMPPCLPRAAIAAAWPRRPMAPAARS